MSAFACSSELHDGQRDRYPGSNIILRAADCFYARLEYRRIDAQERAHVKTLYTICRPCMDSEAGIADQEQLFHDDLPTLA